MYIIHVTSQQGTQSRLPSSPFSDYDIHYRGWYDRLYGMDQLGGGDRNPYPLDRLDRVDRMDRRRLQLEPAGVVGERLWGGSADFHHHSVCGGDCPAGYPHSGSGRRLRGEDNLRQEARSQGSVS